MKMLAWILLSCSVYAGTSAHSQGITLKLSNAPLPKAFAEISRQSGTTFLYTEQLIKDCVPVSVELVSATLQDAVASCLSNQPLQWELINNTVVLSRKSLAPVDSVRIIRGVVSANGAPLPNVSVMIKGSARGTFTDNSGSFTLKIRESDRTLIITSVGFEKRELAITGETVYSIVMTPAIGKLDETVVIAYGSTTRRMNTGNLGRVGSQEISRQPVSNVLSALQGRIPGVVIQQNTGNAGGSFNVRIRGRSSLRTGASDPLYLVDGVPYPAAPVASGYTSEITRGGSPLHFLNPIDIASIEVLKDADATAIYGSRGANGVILITTKKATSARTSLTADVSRGYGTVARKLKMLTTREYLDMRYEAFSNDGTDWTDPFADARDLQSWDTTKYTDWQEELIGGIALFDRINISMSGGNAQTKFLVASGYSAETTVTPGDFRDEKKSVHVNLNHQSNDRKFGLSLSASYLTDRNNLMMQDVTSYAMQLIPVAPTPLTEDGKINWDNGSFYNNPYSFIKRLYHAANDNLVANTRLSYELLPGLTFQLNAGYNKLNADEKNLSPSVTSFPVMPNGGSAMFSYRSITSTIVEPEVTYRLGSRFGNFEWLVGTTHQQTNRAGHALLGYGYTSDALLNSITAAPNFSRLENIETKYRYQALFTRFNYRLKDRYIINLTGRRDGSSRFGPGRQFANFGAIGAAWVFSNEALVKKDFPLLSFGKIRGSIGVTGSDQIDDYGFLDLWRSTTAPYSGIQGLYPNNLFNPVFAWENNHKKEIGLELGFWQDRLLISGSYFRHVSGNQLVGLPVSAVTGFTSLQYNLPAEVLNDGWEFEGSFILVNNEKIKWTPSFNVSFTHNKLLSYPNLASSTNVNRFIIGQPLTITKVYEATGVNRETGLFEVLDANKDGAVTPEDDRIHLINTTPVAYGGLENSLYVYGIELNFLFQFVKQKARNHVALFNMAGFALNQPDAVLNRWTPSNTGAAYQKYSQDVGYMAYDLYSQSTAAYEDASYIRLKNISLSFARFDRLTRQLHLNQLKIYAIAQNLLTLTRYSGLDPETLNISSLPPLRMISMGIQVTF
ncbi:MAG: SusC/RagA family TonB-linked outer membrane protein [Chitinophagaceae bacterium]|nr:SusC/RagA family TonB-linked outer membrane protein [Chitinophagaceae bacterium]